MKIWVDDFSRHHSTTTQGTYGFFWGKGMNQLSILRSFQQTPGTWVQGVLTYTYEPISSINTCLCLRPEYVPGLSCLLFLDLWILWWLFGKLGSLHATTYWLDLHPTWRGFQSSKPINTSTSIITCDRFCPGLFFTWDILLDGICCICSEYELIRLYLLNINMIHFIVVSLHSFCTLLPFLTLQNAKCLL